MEKYIIQFFTFYHEIIFPWDGGVRKFTNILYSYPIKVKSKFNPKSCLMCTKFNFDSLHQTSIRYIPNTNAFWLCQTNIYQNKNLVVTYLNTCIKTKQKHSQVCLILFTFFVTLKTFFTPMKKSPLTVDGFELQSILGTYCLQAVNLEHIL